MDNQDRSRAEKLRRFAITALLVAISGWLLVSTFARYTYAVEHHGISHEWLTLGVLIVVLLAWRWWKDSH